MARSNLAKLGLAAGGGALTTIVVDGAIQYFTLPKAEDGTTDNWWFKYSSLLGGAASILVGLGVGKWVGKEEGVILAVAGIGTALFAPAHTYIAEKGVAKRLEEGYTFGKTAGMLPAGNPAAMGGAVRQMAQAAAR